MENKIFHDIKSKITRYVAQHRLRDAFSNAISLAHTLHDARAVADLQAAEQSYRYMLQYASQGVDDPRRDEIAADLERTVLTTIDRLERRNLAIDSTSMYFSTLRFEQSKPADTLPVLLQAYRSATTEAGMFDIVAGTASQHSGADNAKTVAQREELERRIFNRLWVEFPLTGADREALAKALTDGLLPRWMPMILVGALMLGGLQYHDEVRLELLMDAYLQPDAKLSATALAALAILLHRSGNRKLSQRLTNRLDALREQPNWLHDIDQVYMELVKTIDTDRITRKITEEVVPELLKLRPNINRTFTDDPSATIDPAELEENPEWQEMMQQSGLADKLREMSEIQEEGGDVMMGTFSHLKTYPFFHQPANWFIPFHTEYSDIQADRSLLPMAELLAAMPMLCDSDKFSFMFSLKMVPESQRRMMMEQLRAQDAQLAELRAASLPEAEGSKSAALRSAVQNFYRFFKLFRRKGEFPNPFAQGINPADVPALAAELRRPDMLRLVAEFYFHHGYYPQAYHTFTVLNTLENPTPETWQKMGYALSKLGRLAEAAECYERAEMLDSGRSDWTLTHLARTLLALRRPADALPRYRELVKRHPDKISHLMGLGRTLALLGQYQEAAVVFYKVDFLDEKSGRALRPLAWCLLMQREFDKARRCYEKIISQHEPKPEDYLNMGHLSLAQRMFKEALNFYTLNINARTGSEPAAQPEASRSSASAATLRSENARRAAIDAFIADINADADAMATMGVDTALLRYLIDTILYNV